MAAPAISGVRSTASYSNSSAWALTITSGWSAGVSIIFTLNQSNTTPRTVSSVVASNGDVLSLAVTNDSGGNGTSIGAAHIYYCANTTAMAASGTITVNWSGGASGIAVQQSWSSFTFSSLTDTQNALATGTSHVDGGTGLTTSGDVLIIAVGQLTGTSGTATAGTNYTGWASSANAFHQYRESNAGLTSDQGPWSSTNSRANRGAMAAFYAAGGGGKVTKNTRSAPLGVAVGMGWRMPA
jgi:hypothetical protein